MALQIIIVFLRFLFLIFFVFVENVTDGTDNSFEETTTLFLNSLAISVDTLCTLGTTKKTCPFGDSRCRLTTATHIDVTPDVDAASSDDFRIEIGVGVDISSNINGALVVHILVKAHVLGSLIK